MQALAKHGELDLSSYYIVSKVSCLETLEGTNEPKIIGKKFRTVHFDMIQLPVGRVIVPEELLANSDPRKYHHECSRFWELELEYWGTNRLQALVELLEKRGFSEDMLNNMQKVWMESYLGSEV